MKNTKPPAERDKFRDDRPTPLPPETIEQRRKELATLIGELLAIRWLRDHGNQGRSESE